ncbi:MAG: FAD-dependent monooxygenase [Rickettsiales bacterium]
MHRKYDICILGKGLCGLVSSLSFYNAFKHHNNFRIAILSEVNLEQSNDIRNICLTEETKVFFEDINIWHLIEKFTTKIEDVYIIDNQEEEIIHLKSKSDNISNNSDQDSFDDSEYHDILNDSEYQDIDNHEYDDILNDSEYKNANKHEYEYEYEYDDILNNYKHQDKFNNYSNNNNLKSIFLKAKAKISFIEKNNLKYILQFGNKHKFTNKYNNYSNLGSLLLQNITNQNSNLGYMINYAKLYNALLETCNNIKNIKIYNTKYNLIKLNSFYKIQVINYSIDTKDNILNNDDNDFNIFKDNINNNTQNNNTKSDINKNNATQDYNIKSDTSKNNTDVSNNLNNPNNINNVNNINNANNALKDNLIEANLIIVAEGANSKTRAKYLSENLYFQDHQQTALVFNISHANSHNNSAIEHFTSSGTFAVLPASNSKESSIVWCLKNDLHKYYTNNEKILEDIYEKIGLSYGKVQIISQVYKYSIKTQLYAKYYDANLVLIGDSAHIMHPLAGLGFNQGVKDIKSLIYFTHDILFDDEISASQLNEYKKLSIYKKLNEYEKIRKKDNLSVAITLNYIDKIFNSNNLILQKIRKKSYYVFNMIKTYYSRLFI